MAALSIRALLWCGIAASQVTVLSGGIRSTAAAEIVLESVKPSPGTGAPTRFGLTRDDVRQISSVLPGVQRVVPVRVMDMQARYGDRQVALQLLGTVAEYSGLDRLALQQGRYLLPKDIDNRNNVAVVDTLTARCLFPDGEAIGKSVRIANHYFLIVGLLAPEREASSASRGQSTVARAVIPLTSMHSRYGDTVIQTRTGSYQVEHYELTRIHVVLAGATDMDRSIEVVESLLKKNHEQRDYSVRRISRPASEQ